MPKIFIAIPTVGNIQAEAAHSLMELTYELGKMKAEGYDFVLGVMPRMIVAQAREVAVEQAINTKSDYLFFVDDDMILPRNILRRLLSHDKDIVGSLSWERYGYHAPNLYAVSTLDKNDNDEVSKIKWRNIVRFRDVWDERGLVKADAIGFGVTLINMRVFKGENAISSPYFMKAINIGEDFYFCWEAGQKGWEIFMDCHPLWQTGHISVPGVLTEDDHVRVATEKNMPVSRTEEEDKMVFTEMTVTI